MSVEYERYKAASAMLREMPATVRTVAEARYYVDLIGSIADYDEETAHSCEDKLHQAVLRAICNGEAETPATLCAVAIKTLDILFARWCA